MSRFSRNALATLTGAALLAAGMTLTLPAAPAMAQRAGGNDDQQQQRRTRQAQVIRDEKLAKVLQAAVEQMSAEPPNYKAALETMRGTPALDKLSSYERSKVHQIYASIYATLERYQEAIKSFEAMLREEELPEAERQQGTFNIAQLYMVTEQYQKAISTLEEWFKTAQNPNPDAYFWLCQGYLQLANEQNTETASAPYYKKALKPCVTTIEVAQQREMPLKENWIRAVLIAYQQAGDLGNATKWVKYALVNWPKREYWIQYTSMLSIQEKQVEELAVYEIAYRQGFLTREQELVRLAQMFQFNQMPYKGVVVMEKGMKDKIIPQDRKNMEILANMYTLAREYDKAVDPLTKAAAQANEGPLWERLAQVYIEDEEWAKAADALEKAVRAGGLKDIYRTRILEGMTLAYSGAFDEARDKFKEARRVADNDRERRQIESWLRFVDDEQRRAKDIQTYRIKRYGSGAN
ncbi:MAG: tetratricopeptide repeat protein [Pseudomonadota bacterium]